MSKQTWRDALPALRKHGFEYFRRERYRGHHCHIFHEGGKMRKLMIRSRSHDYRGIYWTHLPSDIDTSSIFWPNDIVYYLSGEDHFYIVPTLELVPHLKRHEDLLAIRPGMYIFNIVASRERIRETGFSLRPYSRAL